MTEHTRNPTFIYTDSPPQENLDLSENPLTMFKLCHEVPDNDIQGFVPNYIIKDDEDNEGFGKKAALKVILRNYYKDYYKDYEDALRQLKLQSLEERRY